MEVSTATALLALIDNPRQDVPLIAVLRSPIFGFPPDRLAELNERFRSEPVSVKSPGSRVGLTNINSRLKLFYGEGHYIQASSGGGITAFRFRVERRALPPQAEKGAPL